jgi:glycerophosphoryl diester phosphodiesterase
MIKKIIIGHRGARNLAHENTLESFKKAIEIGIDMIEFDIRRTKDDVLIVFHDKTINEKAVRNLTYKELTEISEKKGFKVPTLKEVLEFTKNKIKLDIELKETGYEEKVAVMVLKYIKPSDFLIISFNDSSVKKIKKLFPQITTGLLLGKKKPKNLIKTRLSELFPIKRAKKAKADILLPYYKLLKFGFLKRAKKNKYPVYVWTINDETLMKKMFMNDKIAAIATDYPDKAYLIRSNLG